MRYQNKFKLLLIVVSLLVLACSNDEYELEFGDKFISAKTGLTLVDTFSVELYTVKFDSIPTNGAGVLLVGESDNYNFGHISSSSYLEFTTPGKTTIDDLDTYDSVALILPLTNYYGDTLQPYTISVHELEESIELDENNMLYNTHILPYSGENMGQKTFLPKPLKDKTVSIKLKDEFGNYLFEGLRNGDDEIILQDDFLEFFKGIVLKADNSQAILNFSAAGAYIRIYSHESLHDLTKYYDFPFYSKENQFNHIEHNYSETAFSSLQAQTDEVKSTDTDGLSFVQAGTGVYAKVMFPSYENLLLVDKGKVMKAELVLYPAQISYVNDSLPSGLNMYETDAYNHFEDVLTDITGNAVSPEIIEDHQYYQNSSYTFDITEFIKKGIRNQYINLEHGLLVSFNASILVSGFDEIIFDTENFKPRLKIYYLNY